LRQGWSNTTKWVEVADLAAPPEDPPTDRHSAGLSLFTMDEAIRGSSVPTASDANLPSDIVKEVNTAVAQLKKD